MCTRSGFDSSLDSDWIFLMDLLPKIVKTKVSLRLVDYSNDFISCSTNNENKLNFVTPIGLPGKALERFWVYAWLWSVDFPQLTFWTMSTVLKFFFCLMHLFTTTTSRDKHAFHVYPLWASASPLCSCNLRWSEKAFSLNFWENPVFWDYFLFPISYFSI